MSRTDVLPCVHLFSLGGTVAMTSTDTGGATPSVGAADLVDAVHGLTAVATIRTSALSAVPSASLDIAGVLAMVPALESACRDGADGVVVTTGTDTLEEVAYLLDLVWRSTVPLVLTGAMRTADAPGADGPANVLAAVTVAASPAARARGCLVALNDEVHAADAVRKLHTSSPAAFASPSTGPAGRVHEGRVLLMPSAQRMPALRVEPGRVVPRVALVRIALGDDATLLVAALERFDGIVVEALGGGHVPRWWVDPLLDAAARMPVVLASRTGAGPLLERTYGFVGAERQLLEGGLLSAGTLDGLKARILLTLAMMSGRNRADQDRLFAARSATGREG